MFKKTIITALALSVAVTGSSVLTEAQEPLYDQDGNVILDVEQESYQDLSTDQVKLQYVEDVPQQDIQLDPVGEYDPNAEVPITQNENGTGVKVRERLEKDIAATEPSAPKEPEKPQGVMTPESSTYMAGSNTAISTKGSLKISKVEIAYAVGLPQDSWVIAGDSINFDTKKLDTAISGTYDFKVIFEDGSQGIFQLKVLNKPITEDYWQQNITSFSKDKRSNTHRDLELISSSPDLEVKSITIGGVSVPASYYKVINGMVIISKDFLVQLDSSPRARVTVTYGGNRVVDFSLEITDEMEKGNSSEPVDC